MACTSEVAPRSTAASIPKKPCTTTRKSNKRAKRPPTPSSSSSSESESSQHEESSFDSEYESESGSESKGDKINSRKRPCTTPNEGDSPAPVDANKADDREVSREEHDRSLKERDVALNELNSLRVALKELQNNRSKDLAEFEMRKKVWEAEKKGLNDRLDRELSSSAAELKKVQESLSKSKAEFQNNRSKDLAEFEMRKKVWEAEKKGLNDRLDRELSSSAAELKKVQESLSKSKAELEKTSQARDSYKNCLIFGTKAWDEENKAMTARLNNEILNNNSCALAEFELGKKVLEGEKKALTERLDKELSNFAAKLKEVLESLSKSNAELERTCQERESYRNNLELGKKEWEDEKKALTERLNTAIINFGAELKQVLKNLSKSEAELEKISKERDTCKNSLELGNKVWEAERTEMAKKIEMANKEKQNALELGKKLADAQRTETAESIALMNKEKEKAYCKGYLDGWLQKPHAYVQAWHDASLSNEVSDLPVLQKMNNLPKSHV